MNVGHAVFTFLYPSTVFTHCNFGIIFVKFIALFSLGSMVLLIIVFPAFERPSRFIKILVLLFIILLLVHHLIIVSIRIDF